MACPKVIAESVENDSKSKNFFMICVFIFCSNLALFIETISLIFFSLTRNEQRVEYWNIGKMEWWKDGMVE
jgi:hypothetical protein